jgi:ABC-2 type transport system permease protein
VDRLRRLVALKWTLALRGYQRDRTRLVGFILFLVIALPVAGSLSAFCLVGFRTLPGRLPFELLHLVLLGVWAFWALFPVFGFSLNETHDPTKLFAFPVRSTEIFLAGVLGAFLDLPIVFLLPLLLAVLVGFGYTPLGLAVTLAGLALFVAQTLAFSQACLTALLGVLKSRRFQDAATILIPLVSITAFIGVQLSAQRAVMSIVSSKPKPLESLRISDWLLWLPSGMAAAAIEHGASGRYMTALGFLVLLAGVTAATIAVGGAVLRKVHLGDIDVGRAPRPARQTAPARPGVLGRALRRVPEPVRAMWRKELRQVWREPEMKAIIITFLFPVIAVVVALRLAPDGVPQDAWLLAVATSLFGSMHLAMNAFGHDRQALELLLSYPTSRRYILLGKNLAAAVFIVGAAGLALLLVVLLGVAPPSALAGTPSAAALCLIVLAAGNFSSIYFPTRIPRRGENPYTQSVAKGCVTGLFRTVALQVALVVSSPILGGFLGPWLAEQPAWLALTAPLSLVYAIIVYRVSLGPAEKSLLAREHLILQVCAARED